MNETQPKRTLHAAFAGCAALVMLALPACGTVERIKGPDIGASNEKAARNVAPDDPLARPTQVGWTSARASHCGFIFDPAQLRANYLAAEAQSGVPPAQMKKIEEAYDYTRDSVHETIKNDLSYCNKERTTAIRRDLNRYLGGDYTPSARMAQ